MPDAKKVINAQFELLTSKKNGKEQNVISSTRVLFVRRWNFFIIKQLLFRSFKYALEDIIEISGWIRNVKLWSFVLLKFVPISFACKGTSKGTASFKLYNSCLLTTSCSRMDICLQNSGNSANYTVRFLLVHWLKKWKQKFRSQLSRDENAKATYVCCHFYRFCRRSHQNMSFFSRLLLCFSVWSFDFNTTSNIRNKCNFKWHHLKCQYINTIFETWIK